MRRPMMTIALAGVVAVLALSSPTEAFGQWGCCGGYGYGHGWGGYAAPYSGGWGGYAATGYPAPGFVNWGWGGGRVWPYYGGYAWDNYRWPTPTNGDWAAYAPTAGTAPASNAVGFNRLAGGRAARLSGLMGPRSLSGPPGYMTYPGGVGFPGSGPRVGGFYGAGVP